jgi:hypothetical protein
MLGDTFIVRNIHEMAAKSVCGPRQGTPTTMLDIYETLLIHVRIAPVQATVRARNRAKKTKHE